MSGASGFATPVGIGHLCVSCLLYLKGHLFLYPFVMVIIVFLVTVIAFTCVVTCVLADVTFIAFPFIAVIHKSHMCIGGHLYCFLSPVVTHESMATFDVFSFMMVTFIEFTFGMVICCHVCSGDHLYSGYLYYGHLCVCLCAWLVCKLRL